MKLSEHFTLEEYVRSEIATRRGLDNTPDAETIEQLKITAAGMEEVRALLGAPIYVQSGYRSFKVNAAVGGSSSSQHCKGEATDFVAPAFGSPLEICRVIRDSDISFDQLIYEGDWVHISFSERSRHAIMTARFSNGRATYTQGVS